MISVANHKSFTKVYACMCQAVADWQQPLLHEQWMFLTVHAGCVLVIFSSYEKCCEFFYLENPVGFLVVLFWWGLFLLDFVVVVFWFGLFFVYYYFSRKKI